MKKAVISGYYGFENYGDEISLQVIVNALKDQGVAISAFSSKPELTSSENGIICFYTFDIFDVIRQIFVSDVLISGGGSLLQDKTSIKSFLYYIFVIVTAQILGKKVVIFSQGFAPLKHKFLEIILKKTLKKVSYISVRDDESSIYLEKIGIKAKTFSDCVWAFNRTKALKKNKLVIQLRDRDKLTDEKIEIMAKLIAEKYRHTKIEVLPLHEEKDLEICEKIYEELREHKVEVELLKHLNVKEATEVLASARNLIAMRYHACLIGIKHNANILALSYDEKVTNLAQKFDLPYLYVDEKTDLFEVEFKKSLERFEHTRISSDAIRTEEALAQKSLDNLVKIINNIEISE